MAHGESGPLICHGHHKGQGLGGRRADVINPTVSETPNGRTLVGGHEPSIAPGYMKDMITGISVYLKAHISHSIATAHECALLVKCELQGHLYECIWAHLLFFDELFPINFEVENVHVKIIHQPVTKSTNRHET